MKVMAWIAGVVLALGGALALTLLVTDRRVLVREVLINPGQPYTIDGWDGVGRFGEPSLLCRYFTGRSVKTFVFEYSATGRGGIDSCPFIFKP